MTGHSHRQCRILKLLLAVVLSVSMGLHTYALDSETPFHEPNADASALEVGLSPTDEKGPAISNTDPNSIGPPEGSDPNEPTESAAVDRNEGGDFADPDNPVPTTDLLSGHGEHDPESIAAPAEAGAFSPEGGAVVKLHTDAGSVRAGDSFVIDATFEEPQQSNALTLTYTFDSELFEYEDYATAPGAGLLDERVGDGSVMLILMIEDYDAQELGSVTLRAPEHAVLRSERQTVTLVVEYATYDEADEKISLLAHGEVSFSTRRTGYGPPAVEGDTNDDDIVDMIDLSNIIDWFGYTRTAQSDWEDWYIYFDFNANEEIDIFDIAHLARLIGSGRGTDHRKRLERLIAEVEALHEADYTAESWAKLLKALDAARAVAGDADAQEQELSDAFSALQAAKNALEPIGDDDDGDDDDDDDNGTGGNRGGSTNRYGRSSGNGGSYYERGSAPSSTGFGGPITISDPSVPLAGGVPVDHWIDREEALTLLEKAGMGSIAYKHTGTVGIRAEALAALDGRRFHHDTMENDVVKLRMTLIDPAQHESDLLLGGSLDTQNAQTVQALFQSWFRNRTAVVSLNQTGSLGARVEIAVKVALDAEDLHFYSYRHASNRYVALRQADYWLDDNGYLHFYTDKGGSVVISEGALARR